VIGVSMTAAFALAGGIVAATVSTAQADAVLRAEHAIESAHTARADYQDARYRLAAKLERFASLDGLPPVIARLDGALGPRAVAQLSDALAEGRDVTLAQSLSDPIAGPVDEIPGFDERMGLDTAHRAVATAEALADEWTDAGRRVSEADSSFGALLDDIDDRLVALTKSAPKSAGALVEAHGSATQETRDAVVAAAREVATGDGKLKTRLTQYADAVDGLRRSHAAEQARLAAEAAAAAAAAESESSPRSNGARGGSGGGQSSGGGSSGGGGSTGGGGGGGGGGSAPEPDTRRYVDARGQYTPGCPLGPEYYRADPGPGGTSIIASVPYPYDYRMKGTWVVVYICSW